MKELKIIPYLVNHEEKQKSAVFLCKRLAYESRALKHMINNSVNIRDIDKVIRMVIRITFKMDLIVCLLIAYKEYHKYLFGGIVTYFWAEPIGNGMYKIQKYGQLLLNAPK